MHVQLVEGIGYQMQIRCFLADHDRSIGKVLDNIDTGKSVAVMEQPPIDPDAVVTMIMERPMACMVPNQKDMRMLLCVMYMRTAADAAVALQRLLCCCMSLTVAHDHWQG